MLTIRELIKTLYNALIQRMKKYRGNWEQNDPTADDYIKNRPFYMDETDKVVKIDKKYLPDLGLASVATSGDYWDLENIPETYSDVVRYGASQRLTDAQKAQARTNIDTIATNDLAEVAISGNYNDLNNKPLGVDIESKVLNGVEGLSVYLDSNTSAGSGVCGYVFSYNNTFTENFIIGQKYKVIIDENVTILEAKHADYIGDRKIYAPSSTAPDNTGVGFYLECSLSLNRYSLYMPSSYDERTVKISIYKYKEEIIQLDEKFIPNSIARAFDVIPTPAIASVGQTIAVKTVNENGKPTEWETVSFNSPKDAIALIDQVNGYTYIACMRDGNFVTYCAIKSIEVTVMPTKIEYIAGEYFDPTGMVVVATTYDGITKEITDFTYPSSYIVESDTFVEITYMKDGIAHITTIPITVTPFDPVVALVDFEYTANNDGTYTITGWKGTSRGEASTEIIIPDNVFVKL